ncbi:MAG: nitronate monooxygenase [Desulfobacteraceae bacterium]
MGSFHCGEDMFQTRITQMLGIQYPVVGGAMMWVSTPELTAAVSEAGGLGILASAMYSTREAFEQALERTRALTKRPFAVNLNLFPMRRPVDNREYLEAALEQGVRVVETSGHAAPHDLCGRFREAGVTWIHKCVGLRYARKAEGMGADIVTVVGYENGGATGKLDIGTLVLVPRVAQALGIPVIGGGGVSDGRGLLAVLALGAQGVILGTRLLATKEAPLHDTLKQALLGASEEETLLVLRSVGATHRVWANEAAMQCAHLEDTGAEPEELFEAMAGEKARAMYETGDVGMGVMSLGQGVGGIQDIPNVSELFRRMMTVARERMDELRGES